MTVEEFLQDLVGSEVAPENVERLGQGQLGQHPKVERILGGGFGLGWGRQNHASFLWAHMGTTILPPQVVQMRSLALPQAGSAGASPSPKPARREPRPPPSRHGQAVL